jgi:hypothetical protein
MGFPGEFRFGPAIWGFTKMVPVESLNVFPLLCFPSISRFLQASPSVQTRYAASAHALLAQMEWLVVFPEGKRPEELAEYVIRTRCFAYRLSLIDVGFSDSMESVGRGPVWLKTYPMKQQRLTAVKGGQSLEPIFAKYLDPLDGNLEPQPPLDMFGLGYWYPLAYGQE